MTLTTDLVAAAPAPFGLRLFGTFRLSDATGAPVSLPTRKTRLLLAYLATPAGVTHARERLAALLWPDRQPEQARGSLRNAIVALRAALGDAIRADRETCSLAPGAVAVDGEALAALATADPDRIDPDAVLALQAQEFLEGQSVDEGDLCDWLTVERARRRCQLQVAFHAGATRLCDDGRRADAMALAARLVALDPLSERGHRLLMRIHAEAGERSLALAHFQSCREMLRRELGVEPSPETVALAEAITTGSGFRGAGEAVAPLCALSLAVAPFANLSGDPAQDWLAQAVTEELVTELARRRHLMVIARSPRRTATAAGARYALSGAVRRAGGRLRVSARLVEALGDRAVWADRYERESGDLLAAQDEIVECIAAAVDARMRRAEHEAVSASRIASPSAPGAVS